MVLSELVAVNGSFQGMLTPEGFPFSVPGLLRWLIDGILTAQLCSGIRGSPGTALGHRLGCAPGGLFRPGLPGNGRPVAVPGMEGGAQRQTRPRPGMGQACAQHGRPPVQGAPHPGRLWRQGQHCHLKHAFSLDLQCTVASALCTHCGLSSLASWKSAPVWVLTEQQRRAITESSVYASSCTLLLLHK